MMTKKIIFDGDGTLYDSERSIKKSCNHALKSLGYKEYRFDELDFFIGPPLRESFRLCHVKEDDLDSAIDIYRKHQRENTLYDIDLYPNVEKTLSWLHEHGYSIYLGTSRPGFLGMELLTHTGIIKFFDGVFGADDDGKNASKVDVISKVVSCTAKTDVTYMVGDTKMDILAGKKFSCHTIACLYGFGNLDELDGCLPDYKISDFGEIIDIVK